MISLRRRVLLVPAAAVSLAALSCARPDAAGSNTKLGAADSSGGGAGSAPAANVVSGANAGTPNGATTAATPTNATGTSPSPATAAPDSTPLNIPVVTPGPGSSTRTMILDALRQRLNMQTRFKVDHIRMAGVWAFVRATEVVELDKGELQETDLTVSALLELPKADPTKFRVVEVWTLPDEQTHPFTEFIRKVRERVRRERLPVALLPEDFR